MRRALCQNKQIHRDAKHNTHAHKYSIVTIEFLEKLYLFSMTQRLIVVITICNREHKVHCTEQAHSKNCDYQLTTLRLDRACKVTVTTTAIIQHILAIRFEIFINVILTRFEYF